MSDSFNSPNQLSLEKPQESTPEPNAPAANAQGAVASAVVQDVTDDWNDLEAIESSRSGSGLDDEVSFEVIADYVEAEVGLTSVTSSNETDEPQSQKATSKEPVAAAVSGLGSVEEVEIASLPDLEAVNQEVFATDSEQTRVNESLSPSAEDTAFAETSSGFHEEAIASEVGTEADGIEVDAAEVTESFTAPVEVVDVEILESQEQERSYEVHHDGTLTYFQYFLDEEDSAFGPDYGDLRSEANSSPRSFVSATAVGVGVLAATFGAGLLMAEATNRNSLSDNRQDSVEAQKKAEAERKASEASGSARASSPDVAVPDWSETQKAIAVSQSSETATPNLGSLVSPSASSVTSKLSPLAQSWGTSVPLPPPRLPIAPAPIVATAALPTTPTVAPVDLSALQPVPSYQVVQPTTSAAATVPLPNPPVAETTRDEQMLRSRMTALRDRMAVPVAASEVAVSYDDNLLEGPDERWVGNVAQRVNVPLNENGTTLDDALNSSTAPSLTDSPYGNPAYGSPAVANAPASMPPNRASVDTGGPRPIATAPQAYPLNLSPVVPPHQTSSLNEKVVAPVAGLVPTPVAPAPVEALPPQASTAPPHAVSEQVAQTTEPEKISEASQQQSSMEVTPGAIALEVIPPTLSPPLLEAPQQDTVEMSDAPAAVESLSVDPAFAPQPATAVRRAAAAQPTATQASVASGEAFELVASKAGMPKGITSLDELTDGQSSRPLALSRDTARAALANAEQLDQFRVLPLSVREYQRLWQETGNDSTFAPVHGFVDYGQNVIAVVVTRGEVNQASAVGEDADLQRTGAAEAPILTEVSATSSIAAEALRQS